MKVTDMLSQKMQVSFGTIMVDTFHDKVYLLSQLKKLSGKDTLPQLFIAEKCKGTCADEIVKSEENGNLYKWLDEAKVRYVKKG